MDKKDRPLFAAVGDRRPDRVRAALAAGADISARNDKHETALHVAARHGFVEAAAILIRNGATVNARNDRQETPLHVAARHRHADLIRLLIESGADPDARDIKDRLPL